VVHAGSDARAALQFFREWQATASDEVSSFAILWHAPEIDEIPADHHHTPTAIYLAMHSGDAADGERALQPLRDFGSPIADLSGVVPYLAVQQFFDADYPAGERRYYWKSRYLSGLPDEAVDVVFPSEPRRSSDGLTQRAANGHTGEADPGRPRGPRGTPLSRLVSCFALKNSAARAPDFP
jgi:hypothetical protein